MRYSLYRYSLYFNSYKSENGMWYIWYISEDMPMNSKLKQMKKDDLSASNGFVGTILSHNKLVTIKNLFDLLLLSFPIYLPFSLII